MEPYIVPTHMLRASPEEQFRQKMERFQKGFGDLNQKARHLARYWTLNAVIRTTDENHMLGEGIPEMHLCCDKDGQSIARLMTGSYPIKQTAYDIETGIQRHLLQCHRDEIEGQDEDDIPNGEL